MADLELAAAVKATKRTTAYRMWRGSLACLAPSDVWRDESRSTHIVLYDMEPRHGTQAMLAFVLDARSNEVVDLSVLRVRPTEDGWRAENLGIDEVDGQLEATTRRA